jgi:polyisoprenoid-binding protein YceI
MLKKILFSGLLYLFAIETHAANLQPTHIVLKDKSKITYVAPVNGDVMEGEFKDYQSFIHFNPSKPYESYFKFNFKLSPQTISTTNMDVARGVLGSQLDSFSKMGLFIPATFEVREMEHLSDNDYRGRGILHLMGRKHVAEFQMLVVNGDEPLLGAGKGFVTFATYFNIDRAKLGKFKGENASGYNISDMINISANLVTKIVE